MMWRVMACWAVVVALITVTPAPAAPPAAGPAAQDTADGIVCQLLAGCPSSDPAATAPPRGGRTGRTRGGFSFKDQPDSPSTGATAAPATGRYDLRVGFLFASADLTPADARRIALFAAALRDPRIADRRIRIEGHTDSIGSDAANLDLSRRRAHAVGAALAEAGVDGSRLDLEGYGATRPLPGLAASNGSNRRVIASLLP